MLDNNKKIASTAALLAVLIIAIQISAFGTAAPQTDKVQQMKDTQSLTTKQLTSDEQNVGSQRYTPRWAAPVWVPADGLNILIVSCAPGEFALSPMYILQSTALSISESYPVALPDTSMIWLAVV